MWLPTAAGLQEKARISWPGASPSRPLPAAGAGPGLLLLGSAQGTGGCPCTEAAGMELGFCRHHPPVPKSCPTSSVLPHAQSPCSKRRSWGRGWCGVASQHCTGLYPWAKVHVGKGDSGGNLSTVQAGFGSPGLRLPLPAQSQEQPAAQDVFQGCLRAETQKMALRAPAGDTWLSSSRARPPASLLKFHFSFQLRRRFLWTGGQAGMLRAAGTHAAAGPLHDPLLVSLQVAARGDAVAACFCHATATGRC